MLKQGLDFKLEFLCECNQYVEVAATFPEGNRVRYQAECQHCHRVWDAGLSINFVTRLTGDAKLVD